MCIIYYVVMLLCGIVIKKIQRNIYCPAFIVTMIWFIFPLSYEIISRNNANYHFLSFSFYSYVLFAFYLPFCIVSIVASNGTIIKIRKQKNIIIDEEDKLHLKYINLLVNFAIVINAVLIYEIFRWSGTFNIVNIIYHFRIVTLYTPELFPIQIVFLRYLFGLTQPLLIYIFLYNQKIKKYKILVLLIEMGVIVVIYAAKAMLIKFAIIVLCILFLKKKLNIKNAVILSLFVIASIIFVTSSRDSAYVDSSNVSDYIFLYLLSALPALDLLLTGKVFFSRTAFGSNTLGFFYRLSGKLFSTTIPSTNEIEILVPTSGGSVNSNVFTSLGMYYVDFGIAGIVLYAILIGFIFGWIYKRGFIKRKEMFIVLYILEVYALVTQFFGDVFFSYLSMPIQDFFWTIVVAEPVRFIIRDTRKDKT